MTRLTTLMTAALCLGAGASLAEETTLHALRDVMAPSCTLASDPLAHQMREGTLHEIPCRTTAHDVQSLLVLDTGDRLVPLVFAQPSFDLLGDGKGGLRPNRAAVPDISTLVLASSPVIHADSNRVDLSHRIAPGLAEGHLVHSYLVDDFGPRLIRAEIRLTGKDPVTLWPVPVSVMAEVGTAFDLDGFDAMQTPDWQVDDPSEVARLLGLDFPSEEGGRPRLEVEMVQYPQGISVTVVNRGWADDSVSGVAYRVLMVPRDGAWEVTGLGRANICWRGPARVTTRRCH